MTRKPFERSGTAWISKSFESLVEESNGNPPSFDVLIVGSGYGGAIAADTITRHIKKNGGGKVTVGVLERGNEYLPGAFPANSTELAKHIRFGRNNEGLFDFRAGPDAGALVANGLGGGSLINAGVMKRPLDGVFDDRWPSVLAQENSLDEYFDRAELLLGARRFSRQGVTGNTIKNDHNGEQLKKITALHDLTGGPNFELAEVTVANSLRPNSGYVQLNDCLRCGDCATGCNHNAKNSLDTNLLVNAYRRGATIVSGATVLYLERDDDIWLVHTAFTNTKLRRQHDTPLVLKATNVILAAGTFGSTEILKRSASKGLKVSRMLGQRCSTNGDTMIVHYDGGASVNAVGKESDAPSKRQVGSTINAILDFRKHDDPDLHGLLIEEMASPASMRRVFQEIYAAVNTVHRLGDCDRSTHKTGYPDNDIFELKDEQIDKSALYAVMGDDGACGEIEVTGSLDDQLVDGTARIRWPELASNPLFEQQVRALKKLANGKPGHIIQNPLWKLLPDKLALISPVEKGPVVTVHPLGGCAMADNSTNGVVNDTGAVFDDDDHDSVYKTLAVLDGSIVPTALGINPALTIAALSLRASIKLADSWGYEPELHIWPPDDEADKSPQDEARDEFFAGAEGALPDSRPRYRTEEEVGEAFEPEATLVRLTERMSGKTRLGLPLLQSKDWIVELTLRFDPKSLRELTIPSNRDSRITVATDSDDPVVGSKLRIFEPRIYDIANRQVRPPRELEELLDTQAAFVSTIAEGSLRIFQRHRSFAWWRILRTVLAWARNHGLRDIVQAWQSRDARRERNGASLFRSLIALCSHAGEVRKFKYELTLNTPVDPDICGWWWQRTKVRGEKKFTYGMLRNPWNQLMQMKLKCFPGLMCWRRSTMELDLPFLARIRVPLLEIVRQNDGVTALAEFGSFFGYIGRMLLGIHGLNFRAPDEPRDERPPERLPGKLNGIEAEPEIFHVFMGNERPDRSEAEDAHLVPAYLRLARYANVTSDKPPLVMMHGYSASGTTFAHNAVDNNFVKYFHDQGRDVWVVDFRTSCGMPTAREPWSFEQVGYRDIPEAIKFMCERSEYIDPSTVTNGSSGHTTVDVIAHCMGAAMFSMGVLHAYNHLADDYANDEARSDLPKRIHRVVFTQVGPLLVMSPMNIFRGYVMQYFREMLPDRYDFNPGSNPTVADKLLDRMLATVPYPREEYRVENPLLPWRRTPWTRTRHRMDILYGRTFNAANMGRDALRHIDDFFGPLSIDTVTQTINFARYNVISDTDGRNTFVSRGQLKEAWGKIPLCNVNARQNGLVDCKTVYRMESIFRDAGRSFEFDIVEDAGHQDALIGTSARQQTLEKISGFFDKGEQDLEQVRPPQSKFVAYPPWIGPVRTFEDFDGSVRSFRVGTRPTHYYPIGVLIFRVSLSDGDVAMPDGTPFGDDAASRDYILNHATFATHWGLRGNYWDKFLIPPIPQALDPAGEAWLVLMIYNESEALRETMVGYYQPVLVPMLDGTSAPYLGQLNTNSQPWSFQEDSLYHMASGDDVSASGHMKGKRKTIDELLAAGTLIEDETRLRIADATLELLVRQNKEPSFDPEFGNVTRPESLTDTEYHDYFNRFSPSLVSTDAVLDRLADENLDLRDGLMPDVDDAPAGECSFALSSCQYPAGILDGPVAYRSYRETLRRLELNSNAGDQEAADDGAPIVPRFIVLAGDQIYADASAGLFDPSVKRGRFELPYHMWLRFPYVRGVVRQLPTFMLPDDHEITDNWEPIPNDTANDQLKESGEDGYQKYQRGIDSQSDLEFVNDGCRFMLIDTRTKRTARAVDSIAASRLISQEKMDQIGNRIQQRQPNDPPLFIVTPSMLLPRHRRAAQWDAVVSSLRSDGWDGYPLSLYQLLQHVVDHKARNVVFLSGDEHLPCYAKLTVRNRQTGDESIVYSIHTGAAYAPFPFANGSAPEHMPDDETIRFNVDQTTVSYSSDAVATGNSNQTNYAYECNVKRWHPNAADGMTYIHVWREDARWSLRAQFGSAEISLPDLAA